MEYTRILKKGSSGEDVKYIQNCLISLNYSCGASGADGKFGSNTQKAVISYQKNHKDINNNQLSVDGIVGKKTWNAIERDFSNLNKNKYTRLLKKGMSGNDVRYIKDCLFKLKYYSSNITKISNNTFGNDTYNAVLSYQTFNKDISGNKLQVDGIVGKKTWGAIERDFNNNIVAPEPIIPDTPIELLDSYTHISSDKRKKIEADLALVSDIRKEIVLEALQYAYDKDVKGNVRALYLFGANLYDTNLNINYADSAEIDRLAAMNPQYFDGGRKEWMKEQVKNNPKLPASDCSGFEVGYLRKHKLVKNTFDVTANSLCSNSYSTAISKEDLKPGDWVGKSGHIGTYVGGGFVVEFYGGAYGCQLTKLDDRRGYDFIKKKVVKGSAWTKFRKPNFY